MCGSKSRSRMAGTSRTALLLLDQTRGRRFLIRAEGSDPEDFTTERGVSSHRFSCCPIHLMAFGWTRRILAL